MIFYAICYCVFVLAAAVVYGRGDPLVAILATPFALGWLVFILIVDLVTENLKRPLNLYGMVASVAAGFVPVFIWAGPMRGNEGLHILLIYLSPFLLTAAMAIYRRIYNHQAATLRQKGSSEP